MADSPSEQFLRWLERLLFADGKPMKIDLVEVSEAGEETVFNEEFVSPRDAAAALRMWAEMNVLPDGVKRFYARDNETGEWIAEVTRKKTNQ